MNALAEQVDGPFHLVGHSYGGCVALHAAMALQNRLLSLTLIEPGAFYLLRQQGESAAWREINKVAIRQMELCEKGELESCADEFMSYWTGKPASEAVSERGRKFIAQTMPSIAAIWGSLFDQSFGLKNFPKFPFPTLLVRGTETRMPAKKSSIF